MAMKVNNPKPSKKTIMSFMVLVLLGWLILMAWASSLWCLNGFDKAIYKVNALLKTQTLAISEFNGLKITNQVKSWLPEINHINQAKEFVKKELAEVLPEEEFNDIAQDFIAISHQVWQLFGLITQVMLIKLIILICAIPLFLLTTSAGLVDGLNQRAIRTASLGRESSYVFHQLNRYFKRALLLVLAVWLAIPLSITPALVFVPLSLLLSIVVSMTASRFKKHL